ncbi:hypothetical protein C8R45DRAFT_1164942 [Mycena sanguinolenta]|nr:hypothetical protein C8R45DRAFT_1164942 [Mycena sanguinolenta]
MLGNYPSSQRSSTAGRRASMKKDSGTLYILKTTTKGAQLPAGLMTPMFGTQCLPNARSIGDHLGGTHYVFQGQKIGMRNFPRSWGISEYKDINSQNFYQEQVASFVPQLYQLIVWASRILANCHLESGGKAEDAIDMSDVLDSLQKKARDHGCIPMQWDSSAHGGFTTVMFQPGPEATKPRLFGSASQAQAEPTYGPEPAFGPAWQSSRPRPSLKAAASVVLMLKFVNVNAKLGSSFGPIVFREGAGPEGQIFADFELYFLSGFW